MTCEEFIAMAKSGRSAESMLPSELKAAIGHLRNCLICAKRCDEVEAKLAGQPYPPGYRPDELRKKIAAAQHDSEF